jgi:hypothetical protein
MAGERAVLMRGISPRYLVQMRLSSRLLNAKVLQRRRTRPRMSGKRAVLMCLIRKRDFIQMRRPSRIFEVAIQYRSFPRLPEP